MRLALRSGGGRVAADTQPDNGNDETAQMPGIVRQAENHICLYNHKYYHYSHLNN